MNLSITVTCLTITLVALCVICINSKEICDVEPQIPPGETFACKINDNERRDNGQLMCEYYPQFQIRGCFCDEHCAYFGDCCDEYISNITALEDITFSCSTVDGVYSQGVNVYVVDRCPSFWKEEGVREACEVTPGIWHNWPVTGEHDILYKNVYCAQCNEENSNITYWLSNFTCDFMDQELTNSTNIADIIDQQNETSPCNVSFVHPDAWHKYSTYKSYRLCKPNIDNCPDTWEDECVRNKCEAENATVLYRYDKDRVGVTYKNPYCALCNSANITCVDSYTKQHLKSAPYFEIVKGTSYPLCIVIDLNLGSGVITREVGYMTGTRVKVETEIVTCPAGEIFDPYSAVCKVVKCPLEAEYRDGKCVSTSTSPNNNTCSHYAKVNQSSFEFYSNGSIFDPTSGRIYGKDLYVLDESGMYLCIVDAINSTEITRNVTETYLIMKFSYAQTVVSNLGQSLSVLALVILLVVYGVYPVLRNLPGKNLMCLSGSLLMFQLMQMTLMGVTHLPTFCVTSGILIHFSLLAVFCWMSVLAYDIWSTFSAKITVSSIVESDFRFLKFSLYAWGCPTFIILIGVLVNFCGGKGSNFSPDYGKHICYISNRYALMVYVGAPLIGLLFADCVFYALTIISIHRTSNVTTAIRESCPNRHRLWLYVKLTSITGLTWVFGLIGFSTDLQFLWWVYILLNSLQGVFICVSFVCTRKVFKMMRETYRRKPSVDASKSTSLHTQRTSVTSETAHRTH